jgi:hypothetical protein
LIMRNILEREAKNVDNELLMPQNILLFQLRVTSN